MYYMVVYHSIILYIKKRKSFPLQNFVCEKKVIKYNWQVNLKLNGKSEKVLLAFNTKILLHCNIEFSYHFFIHLGELLSHIYILQAYFA